MGFFKRLLKKSVKNAMKTPKKSVARKEQTWEEDDLAYTVKLDDWLQGRELFETGLHRKHPEVIRRAHKTLIDETLKEHGAVELEYGRDGWVGEFFILAANEENFKCRELPDTYSGEGDGPPLKTFKYDKVVLQKFVSGYENQGSILDEIKAADGKAIDYLTVFYIDEKTGKDIEIDGKTTFLRVDNEFLYFKERPSSKKEKMIRLKWIESIEVEFEEEEEEDIGLSG